MKKDQQSAKAISRDAAVTSSHAGWSNLRPTVRGRRQLKASSERESSPKVEPQKLGINIKVKIIACPSSFYRILTE